jgi:hypothetical protein
MMISAPAYVSVIFIMTALATVGVFLFVTVRHTSPSIVSHVFLVLLPLWMIVQAMLAWSGFYQDTSTIPPRMVLTGVLPALLAIVISLLFFRDLVGSLPLRALTLIHVIRIPVELVLLCLFQSGDIPRVMTFEGRNFDILSGILALVIFLIAFGGGRVNRPLLVAFNILGLILLANIVSIAVMALPSPMQQIAFDQPNRAVLFFPYIWLPTVVVPIVLFSHLASLYKLATGRLT